MYRNILVPIDGSTASGQSLPVAAAIARRCGARLHVVTVHDPSMFIPFVPGEVAIPVYDAQVVNEQRHERERDVALVVERLKTEGIDVAGRLIEGTTAETLAQHVLEIGADLTVMSTHGRSGFNRLRLGSVANAFVTRAGTPTLLVRIAEGDVAPHAVPAGTLLCPLDGSPFAEAMLPHARTFADALGLHLKLLSITIPAAIPMAPFGTEAMLADPRDMAVQEHGREHYLEHIATECPPDTEIRVVTDLSVGSAIIEAASQDHVGAIAIATHGRGGFMRMVLGSVADEVLRGADVPILVYRPHLK